MCRISKKKILCNKIYFLKRIVLITYNIKYTSISRNPQHSGGGYLYGTMWQKCRISYSTQQYKGFPGKNWFDPSWNIQNFAKIYDKQYFSNRSKQLTFQVHTMERHNLTSISWRNCDDNPWHAQAESEVMQWCIESGKNCISGVTRYVKYKCSVHRHCDNKEAHRPPCIQNTFRHLVIGSFNFVSYVGGDYPYEIRASS